MNQQKPKQQNKPEASTQTNEYCSSAYNSWSNAWCPVWEKPSQTTQADRAAKRAGKPSPRSER